MSEGSATNTRILNTLNSCLIGGIPAEFSILLQQLMQESSQVGKTRNEGAELCYHAKELLKLCDVSWCGQGMYSIHFLWIWVESRLIIEASKEFHHLGLDLCLLGVEHHTILPGNLHEFP